MNIAELIEFSENLSLMLNGPKRALIEQGWDESTAEVAIVSLFNYLATVQKNQNNAE